MATINKSKAVKQILNDGVLLVYPLGNSSTPPSLWTRLFPRTKMRWEWDDEGDSRVADLWRARENLSHSREVVYAKWFRGRATFFSPSIFVAFLSFLHKQNPTTENLSSTARLILEILQSDSPLSTKELKFAAELQGRSFQSVYERAMKELWSGLWVVGYGEKDDGAFPSLLIGATQTLFEDLWLEAQSLSDEEALKRIGTHIPQDSPFFKQLMKIRGSKPVS